MRPFSFIGVLVVVALVLSQDVCAQWQRVSGPIFLSPNPKAGGAMMFHDGILWAGANALYMSTDLGTTWNKTNFPDATIYDIYFVSPQHGAVAADDQGLWLTSDAGNSWTQVARGYIYDVIASSTLDTLIASRDDALIRSTDRGKNWSAISNMHGAGVLAENLGTIYYLDSIKLATSTDWGTTWTHKNGAADFDCHEFAFDPCTNLVYLVNEELWSKTDNLAAIYATNDNGNTWYPRATQDHLYYAGNLVATSGALYAQTISDGVILSTDDGNTWQHLGGPSGQYDQKMLAVVDPGIVLAVDRSGQLWSTNAGVASRPGVRVVPAIDTLFARHPLPPCIPSRTEGLRLEPQCGAGDYQGFNIIGGSGSYSFLKGSCADGADSIIVTFTPQSVGDYPATLVVHYANARDLRIPLFGREIPQLPPHRTDDGRPIFAGDTVSACGGSVIRSVTLRDDCHAFVLDSFNIVGADSTNYTMLYIDKRPSQNSFTLSFAAAQRRNYTGELVLHYGTTIIRVPLAGVGIGTPPPVLLTTIDTVFKDAKLSTCNAPVFVTLALRDTCAHLPLDTCILLGKNINDYAISFSGHDPASGLDTVTLAFLPDSERWCHATLRVKYPYSSIDIPLGGRGLPIPGPQVLMAFDTLFKNVTVSACDDVPDQIVILRDTCDATQFLGGALHGKDSDSYMFWVVHEPNLKIDTVDVRFTPRATGLLRAHIDLIYPSADTVRIPLAGTAQLRPGIHLMNTEPLFAHDSLSSCDAPRVRTIALFDSCSARSLVAARISGADTQTYSLASLVTNANGHDSVQMQFHPSTIRAYHGTVTLVFSDSSRMLVPLSGFEINDPAVSILPATVQPLNIIGGTVSVPIIVHADTSLGELDLRMTYDTAILVYQDAIWTDNTSATSKSTSFDRVAIALDMTSHPHTNDTVAFARFAWFPTTTGITHITIDSITTTPSPTRCLSLLDSTVTIDIDGSASCNSPILSKYLRYREPVTFRMVPNPAHSNVTITTNAEDYRITITDAVGREQLSMDATSNSIDLDVSHLAEGIYFVSLRNDRTSRSEKMIIQR